VWAAMRVRVLELAVPVAIAAEGRVGDRCGHDGSLIPASGAPCAPPPGVSIRSR
jgi:hypothetical protein